MITKENALPGRIEKMPVTVSHFVNGHSLLPPFSDNMQSALFGLGCFWGGERKYWQVSGVYTTAVGYTAGYTRNPTYEEVCSGLTGHNEAVYVIYNPDEISYDALLKIFWEAHNPTQGMRQGNDIGSQYRSGIYFFDPAQQELAEKSKVQYQTLINDAGYDNITTEIVQASEFYYAEEYHQQYLAKNPNGYCGLGGVGVCFTNK